MEAEQFRGGTVIWRTVLYHPKLVSHVFSVCTPYNLPDKTYRSTEDIVKVVPHFGYQLHLASGEVEKNIQSREDIRQFLKGVHGERGPNKENLFSPTRGILFENLHKIGDSGKLDPKVRFYMQVLNMADYGDPRLLYGPISDQRITWTM
jgi:soluble epoxide hydrolase / lipid-phosphate phosphatase